MARTLTVEDFAELVGVTPKALRRRIERGTVQSVLVNGRRRIPDTEARRVWGLDPTGASSGVRMGSSVAEGQGGSPDGEAVTVVELLDRIERQAAELGELRLLTAQATSTVEGERKAREAAETELHRVRAQVVELEARLEALQPPSVVGAGQDPGTPQTGERRGRLRRLLGL